MTNQNPLIPPIGDDSDPARSDDDTAGVLDPTLDDERPLDPDLDDDQLSSAEADERAATEGTIDVDELP